MEKLVAAKAITKAEFARRAELNHQQHMDKYLKQGHEPLYSLGRRFEDIVNKLESTIRK